MIAGRFLKFAQDFVADFSHLDIQVFIGEVKQLCAARPQTTTGVFTQQSRALRAKAEQIIQGTRFRAYPQYYLDLISATPYARLLPARIAEVVISGLTDDVTTTMPSGEITAIASSFEVAYRELSSLVNTLTKLNVTLPAIPTGQVSVEFQLPRSAFDNLAIDYLKWNERVNTVLSSYNEYVGSEDNPPKLVFTSTTDPIIGFAVSVGAAYGVIQLINGLLDIGKKAIDLYSAVRLMRERGVTSTTGQMQIEAENITRADVGALVEKTFKTLKSDVEINRRHELHNSVSINAVVLLPIIVEGASISVSPESLEQLRTLKPDLIITESPAFLEMLVENRLREIDLRTAVRLNGGLNVLRLAQTEPEVPKPPTA